MPATDDLVRFEASGLSWCAERASAEVVRAAVAERVDDFGRIEGAELLKRNMVRAVWRVPLPDGTRVIVKRYRVGGARDWVKYAVRDSRALTEWRIGRGLRAAGIPTAAPLAYAERHEKGVLRDAALVAAAIEDASSLNVYVETHLRGTPERDALRRAFYDELARLVRRMHDARFVHNDFHGGNLLVSGPPEGPSIHVIDLHSVTRRAHPGEGARWFDLVKLLHSMLTCSTAAERLRICEVYETTGGPSGVRVGGLLAEDRLSESLEPRIAQMERRRVRSRTDRSLRRSSKFEVTVASGLRIHHLRTVTANAVMMVVEPHRRDVGRHAQSVLKDGSRTKLSRQLLATPDGPRAVVVKEYRGSGFLDRAKNTLRTPRAIASWVAGNGLVVRGFDAAQPIAIVLRGRGPTLSRAWLVMEDLGDGTRADLVALERYAGPLDAGRRREKRALVEGAADLVRRLHASGVYHGDLKAVNLFVRGAPSEGRIALADYDRVEFDRRVPLRRRVKNLAQLSASVPVCVSLPDRLRFFLRYAQGAPDVSADWKRWFRRVTAECRRKIVVRMQPIE